MNRLRRWGTRAGVLWRLGPPCRWRRLKLYCWTADSSRSGLLNAHSGLSRTPWPPPRDEIAPSRHLAAKTTGQSLGAPSSNAAPASWLSSFHWALQWEQDWVIIICLARQVTFARCRDDVGKVAEYWWKLAIREFGQSSIEVIEARLQWGDDTLSGRW